MNRRRFLGGSMMLATGAILRAQNGGGARRGCVLLHGKLQGMNIGTIGHTLGALRLFERRLPEAEVILWSGRSRPSKDPPDEAAVRALIARVFPRVRVVDGGLDPAGRPVTPALAAAWQEADLLIHGSGSGFAARDLLMRWSRVTGKPYGVCGVSMDPVSGGVPEGGTLDQLRGRMDKLPARHLAATTREVIAQASFMYCRETMSRDYLRSQQAGCPVLELGLDMQFDMEARDDAAADAFLQRNSLKPQQYICVVPRLRYTPTPAMLRPGATGADAVKVAINTRTAEADHARLREVIVRWVRTTGRKVIACPEMAYQVKLAKELLVDPLPSDVAQQVVWRDSFWMPDEAASVYARAVAVISAECHSPIISLAMGTPALHMRQPTDTCKGQMFRDIGLGEWLFEADETTGASIWDAVRRIVENPVAARERAQSAMTRAAGIQQGMAETIARTIRNARLTGSRV